MAEDPYASLLGNDDYFKMELLGYIWASMVIGWQRRAPIRKGVRVDSNLVG